MISFRIRTVFGRNRYSPFFSSPVLWNGTAQVLTDHVGAPFFVPVLPVSFFQSLLQSILHSAGWLQKLENLENNQ